MMHIGRGDLRLESCSADTPPAPDAVDAAVMGTEIAGQQSTVGLPDALQQFSGLIKSKIVHAKSQIELTVKVKSGVLNFAQPLTLLAFLFLHHLDEPPEQVLGIVRPR